MNPSGALPLACRRRGIMKSRGTTNFSDVKNVTEIPSTNVSSSMRELSLNNSDREVPSIPLIAGGVGNIQKVIKKKEVKGNEDDGKSVGSEHETNKGNEGDLVSRPVDDSLISRLPYEILIYILAQVAIDSPRAFVRSQLIGRPLWIPHDSALLWEPICRSIYPELEAGTLDVDDYGGYFKLFRNRPAIRFDGAYVCMSRYYREGVNEGVSWTKPLHEVRYYRYFWMKADGSCRSLLANYSPEQLLGPLNSSGSSDPGGSVPSQLKRTYKQDIMSGNWLLDPDTKELTVTVDGGRRNALFNFEMKVASSGGKVHNKVKWQRYWCEHKDSGNIDEFKTELEGAYFFVKYNVNEDTAPSMV